MSEPESDRPAVQFTLKPNSPTKRPEQLARLLDTAIRQEFPEVGDSIEICHAAETGVVEILHLDHLENQVAEKLAHRARVVYNEFMISPWY